MHHLAARTMRLPSRIVAGATEVDLETDVQELVIALAPLVGTLALVTIGSYLMRDMPGATPLTRSLFRLVSAGWILGCAHDVAQAAATLRRMLA
jgi:hypothetical protein